MLPIPGAMQATLVSFYGEKPKKFVKLIHDCQNKISESLRSAYTPYQLDQVHATIVGLEGHRHSKKILNANFLNFRHEHKLVQLDSFLGHLRAGGNVPIEIQIGGYPYYQDQKDVPFSSQGKQPYERTFSIRADKVVAMGWPAIRLKRGDHDMPLHNFRKAFQEVNVLHKEHRTTTDTDDDFYFVLGHVDRRYAKADEIEKLEKEVREFLAQRPPTRLSLGLENLSIVAYLDAQLPVGTSCRFRVTDTNFDGSDLLQLYPKR